MRRISVIEAQEEYKLRIIDEQKESALNVYREVELLKNQNKLIFIKLSK